MEEEPRKKTLKCKCDLFSWVVIIMHVPRFDLVNIPFWLMELILECP